MNLTRATTSTWRVAMVGVVLMYCVLSGSMAVTAADAPTAARQADAAADPFKFTSDAALIMWQIKPDAAADFEMVWRVIRQRVQNAGGAEIKALVDSITIYTLGVATGDSRTYVFQISPVAKTGSYSPTFLLYESKLFERPEADELFKQMADALMPGDAISMMPLKRTE